MSELSDFKWRPWQQKFIKSAIYGFTPSLAAIRVGIGSGKSAALCYLAGILAVTRPGSNTVILTDTWPRLRDVILPLCQDIFTVLDGVYSRSERTWHFPCGSKVHLRAFWVNSGQGLSQSALEGLNAHAFLVDECQVLDNRVLKVAVNRCRIAVADVSGIWREPLIVLCGVPEEPAWWLDDISAAGGLLFLPTSAENADALSPEWFDRQRAILLPEEYEALINNRPSTKTGKVLDTWGAHCITPPGWTPPRGAERLVTADLGLRMPAAIAVAEDAVQGCWVAYDEWMPDNVLTGEFGVGIYKRWKPDRLICDPAGGSRNVQTGQSDLSILSETTGVWPETTKDPTKRDIRAGIIRLRRALASGRLKVTQELWDAGLSAPRNQRTLARAILGYRYPEKGGDQPLKDGRHDHAVDALRYFVLRELWYDHPLDGRMGYTAPD